MNGARRIGFDQTGAGNVHMSVPTEVAMALVDGLLASARWPVWITAVGLFLAGLGAMAAWFGR